MIGQLKQFCVAILAVVLFLAYFSTSCFAKRELLPRVIEFKAPNLFPEAIDWDFKAKHFFLSARGEPSIFQVYPDGAVHLFVHDSEFDDVASFKGITVDHLRGRNRVLATLHSLHKGKPFDAVVAYNADTGKRLLFIRLDTLRPGPSSAGDVSVDHEGNIYVANTALSFIWKINLEGDAQVFTRPGAFGPQGSPLGFEESAQGITGMDIRGTSVDLLACQGHAGAVFRISLPDKSVSPLQLRGLLTEPRHVELIADHRALVLDRASVSLLQSTDDWESAEVVEEVQVNEMDGPIGLTFAYPGQALVLYGHYQEAHRNITRDTFRIERLHFKELHYEQDDFGYYVFIAIATAVILAWLFILSTLVKKYGTHKLDKVD